MKKLYDAVHTEKYTDKQTGEERKKYTKIGAVFQRDDGSMCMAFLGSWINFYEPRIGEKEFKQAKQVVQNTPHDGGMDDSIPFASYFDVTRG